MPAFADSFRIRKPTGFLREEQKKVIHEGALEIMESVGVRIHSKIARESLKAAGASVDDATGVVRFPEGLVQSLISSVPEEIVLAGREKEFDLPLDGTHCYHTTDGCGISVWDQTTRSRRLSVLQDVRDSAVIADHLPRCSIYEPMVVASDVDEKIHVVSEMKEAFDISRKHVESESTSTAEEARLQVRMASEVVGGFEELKKRHIMSAMVCTMSPLTLDGNATDATMVWAEAHVPVCITGMVMMGMSGPATYAGDLVINHAETLALAAAMQAHEKGAPLMYGSVLSSMDPRTGAAQLSSPEGQLLCALAHDMAKYVKMPSACGGLGSNAKVPGIQAALENGIMATMSAILGQEVNNGIGLLDCSTVLSYEQMIIDDDIIGRALVCGREISTSKEALHLDMIKDVGILGMGRKKGSFLAERATMAEARSFFQSSIFTSEPFEQWVARGKRDELVVAKERADWILQNHEPEMLDRDISKRLDEMVKEGAKTL